MDWLSACVRVSGEGPAQACTTAETNTPQQSHSKQTRSRKRRGCARWQAAMQCTHATEKTHAAIELLNPNSVFVVVDCARKRGFVWVGGQKRPRRNTQRSTVFVWISACSHSAEQKLTMGTAVDCCCVRSQVRPPAAHAMCRACVWCSSRSTSRSQQTSTAGRTSHRLQQQRTAPGARTERQQHRHSAAMTARDQRGRLAGQTVRGENPAGRWLRTRR